MAWGGLEHRHAGGWNPGTPGAGRQARRGLEHRQAALHAAPVPARARAKESVQGHHQAEPGDLPFSQEWGFV